MIETTRAVWVCVAGCTGGKWPVFMSRCPHCGGSVEREQMPKISVHGGASDAVTGAGMPEPTHIDGQPVVKDEGDYHGWGADGAPGDGAGGQSDESPSTPVDNPVDERSVVVAAAEVRNYSKMLKADLVDEAASRGLPTEGTADELRERLAADDAVKASAGA